MADNAGITQSQTRDTRYHRMQELNSLCVSKQVNSFVTCGVRRWETLSLAYIAVCPQIHCNPSSLHSTSYSDKSYRSLHAYISLALISIKYMSVK